MSVEMTPSWYVVWYWEGDCYTRRIFDTYEEAKVFDELVNGGNK